MKTLVALALLLGLVGCRAASTRAYPAAARPATTAALPAIAGPRLAHDVYFALREDTKAQREALMESCRALATLPGVVTLSVGTRAQELTRSVNDLAFDVALHVEFADRKSHDDYQVAPAHQALLAEWGPHFESVRVFDSWVD